MTEKEINNRSIVFLIANLGLAIVCIIGLVILIVIVPLLMNLESPAVPTITNTLHPTGINTSTQPAGLIHTPTLTPLPTLTFTISPTPTWTRTPTLTPLPTGLPTLTPAKPLGYNEAYNLKEWTAEDADYMIRLMEDYPATLPLSARGENYKTYYDAFGYAIIAQKEAIRRFPEAPQVDAWQWGLAYNLARVSDPQAGQTYSDLIGDGFNKGDVGLDDLYTWFQTKEPNLELFMIPLDPLPGYIGNYLIEIRGKGSAFIWLLQTSSAYQTYPIFTRFDFINYPQANWIVTDLNSDLEDGKEVAIYFSNPPEQLQLDAPTVFSLSQVPPKQLSFYPDKSIFNVGADFTNYWAVSMSQSGENELLFKSTVFPACPVTIRRVYGWNDIYFRLVDESYEIEKSPTMLSYCDQTVNHVVDNWGPGAAIPVMEYLLPNWPPEMDSQGVTYPVDAKDEWKFRLGIYYALVGDQEKARQYFSDIISNPTVYNSSWILPSQSFLDSYTKLDDIYVACVGAPFCDPDIAIDFLVNNLPPGKDALEFLRDKGVTPSSSGYFDFDNDEESERWFTARHQAREKLKFWILTKYVNGVKSIPIAYVDTTEPELDYLDEAYIDEDSINKLPTVFLDRSVAFRMHRTPESQEPYLKEVPLRKEYPNRFFNALEAAKEGLFAGAPAKIIQQQLIGLEDFPGLLCKSSWSCDSYYYILGLASELAWDFRSAVETYHRLWLDYSKSPFTTMARLKLKGEVYYSPTPTATNTLTSTITFTPSLTISGTPATSTFTLTGTQATGTLSLTVTPSITGTPPTATITRTASITPSPGVYPTPTYP